MDDLKTRFSNSSRHINWGVGLKIGGAFIVLLSFVYFLPLSQRAVPLKSWSCKNVLLHGEHPGNIGQSGDVIPNLVHFVYLVDDPSEPDIQFSLRQFISIYSAYHYLSPDMIYIHTNLDQDIIDNIWEICEDTYVQAVGQIRNLKLNRYLAPNVTSTNKTIDKLPKQSDFVRTGVLKKFGGVYLDIDAYILRDLRPLRHLGFEVVTGRQQGGQLCPAVILSTPNNAMITAYHALQDQTFDRGWATHATHLLTALVYDFAESGYMSLILPVDTFFPGSWKKDDLEWIYKQREKSTSYYDHEHTNPSTFDLTDFVSNFELDSELGDPDVHRSEQKWHDWRLSYVLYGWTSGISGQYDEEGKKDLFGAHGDINLDYVLSRKSNFARAVYPAVQHALNNGVLSIYQELKVLTESPMNNGTDYALELSDKYAEETDAKEKGKGEKKKGEGEGKEND